MGHGLARLIVWRSGRQASCKERARWRRGGRQQQGRGKGDRVASKLNKEEGGGAGVCDLERETCGLKSR